MKSCKLFFLMMLLFPLLSEAMGEDYFKDSPISQGPYFDDDSENIIEKNIIRIREAIEQLIEQNIKIEDDKWALLLGDASHHDECSDLVKMMLEKEINPNIAPPLTNPLCAACASEATMNVKLLLSYGADPNLYFPLVDASRNCKIKIVKLLLGHKNINIDVKDGFGNNALAAVFSENHGKFLYQRGERVYKKIVDLLLKDGLDPTLKNNAGQNAIELSRQRGFGYLADKMECFWNNPIEYNYEDD